MTRIVLSLGTWDLMHPGHVFLLRHCREIAGPKGRVVVGVNSNEFAGRFKPAPVQTLHERMTMLAACRFVDEVVENFGCEDATVVIEQVPPQFLVIGQDWAQFDKDYYAQLGLSQPWLDDRGICLLYVPRPPGSISSTEVKRRVRTEGVR